MNEFPLDKLGPYPILQFFVAVLIACGVAFAVYRGSRDRGGSPPSLPGEQRYFFDGPIGEALKLMRDTRNILNEIREHVAPLGEQARNTNRELGEIKDELARLKDAKLRR